MRYRPHAIFPNSYLWSSPMQTCNTYILYSFIFILVILPLRSAFAISPQGWGRVNMQGAIIDTACAISVETRDQTINMEVIPISVISTNGQGYSKKFSIELVNCILERHNSTSKEWKQFQVTFDGDSDGSFFGIQGEASGVALRITDDSGNIATPGVPLRAVRITPGTMLLNYNLRLVANKHTLKAGNYFSSIRFKLDYF